MCQRSCRGSTAKVAATALFLEEFNFCDIKPCSPLKTDASEEHIASTFKVEEKAEQETSEEAYGKQSSV
jgi:hypothetical protein